MLEVMRAQDCLYTLVVKREDGSIEPTVIGSVVDYVLAPDDPEAVLELMADPATRIVSLTITEGGYHVDRTTGELDADDADLRTELVDGAAPRTAFGFLVEALDRRRRRGTPPFTVVSCDNLPGNGDVARRTLSAFTHLRRPELGPWLDAEVAFPNSMVDRITPVTTDEDRDRLLEQTGTDDRWPVVCEPFRQWVLEDRFTLGRPPLEDVGVQVVDDVAPYEQLKLRLLNGGHQALGYLGYLAGDRHTHEVLADPAFVAFLTGYFEEAASTLRPVRGVDLAGYQAELLRRFAHPAIADTLARLCAESSHRIPQFLLPVVRDRLEAGADVSHSALVIAAWARYAEGVDEQGEPIDVVDPLRDELTASARRQRDDPLAFLEHRSVFGDLRDEPAFTRPYAEALASLHRLGARETVRRAVREPAGPLRHGAGGEAP